MEVALIIVIAVVVAGGLFWWIRTQQNTPEAIKEAKRGLRVAEKELRSAERQAKKDLATHDATLKKLNEELSFLRSSTGALTAKLGGLRLYELAIETPRGSGPLTSDATVDITDATTVVTEHRDNWSGEKIIEETVRRGSVIISIDHPDFAHTEKLDAKHHSAAFDFVAEFKSAAKLAPRLREERASAVPAAEARIAEQQGIIQEVRRDWDAKLTGVRATRDAAASHLSEAQSDAGSNPSPPPPPTE